MEALPSIWFTIIGALLLTVAVAGSYIKRLPLSTAILYLGAGLALGPTGLALLTVDPQAHATLLEHLTEIAVIISLFTAGLKLRVPLTQIRWRPAFRLASISMVITVGFIAVAGVLLLDLPIGAAVLLGAILAPTDPVLASDVQIEHPTDVHDLRFSLTGEAGLNDGTAFPFVMLALGLMGHHELGPSGLRWILADVLWAVGGGLALGAGLGTVVARGVLYLRRTHKEAAGLDDFLALGLIALSYGTALVIHTYGFLAVFAAGLAMRRVEMQNSGPDAPELTAGKEDSATDPEKAPAFMAHALLEFNEQLERMGEIAVVVVIGAMIHFEAFTATTLAFLAVLFFLVRPGAVLLGLLGSNVSSKDRVLISWFGIRGIGSLYYLMYATTHGLESDVAVRLASVTIAAIVASALLHGISVTPLMKRYA